MSRFTVIACCLAFGGMASAAPPGWPALNVDTAGAVDGSGDAAVVVGVQDYLFVADVDGASQNANDWYRYLYKGRRVPLGSITLLRNNEATREAMLGAAETAARRVKPGGVLWFVFIGHGAPSQDGKDGMFVGVDAQQNAMSLFARSMGREQVRQLLQDGKQAQTVMVVDACFSGRSGSGQQLVLGLQPLIVVADKAARSDLIMLTAAKSDEFAGALPGMRRPAFSYLLLGALLGWGDGDRDGSVTAKEAWEYTEQVLSGFLTGRRQTPELTTKAQDYALARGASQAGPDLAEMRLGGTVAPTQPTAPAPVAAQPGRPVVVQQAVSLPLTITTEPPGVPVEVDGRRVGTSPVTVSDLPAGNHVVAAFFGDEVETESIYTSSSRAAQVELKGPRQTRFEVHVVFSQMFGELNADEGIYWVQFGWQEWGSRWFVLWLEGGLGLGWARPGGAYREELESGSSISGDYMTRAGMAIPSQRRG